MTDPQKLVAAVLAGDRKAFKILIQQYQKLVSHIVFRMVPVSADREDICQEVFIKVYQHLSGFRFDSKLSTWIGRIAYNTSLNFLEKKRLPLLDDLGDDDNEYIPADDAGEMPDEALENKELKAILNREIEKLPPVYQTVVMLFHLDHLSYEQIGQITQLPDGTVKSYLFRARRLLKDRLLRQYRREEI